MNLELISSNPAFAEIWHRWRAEQSSVKFNPVVLGTVEELRERMKLMSSDLSHLGTSAEFQFFIRVDGDLAGVVSLKSISHMMAYGEIGYSISEAFQGRGIGTLAVKNFVARIFRETSLRRLLAYVAEGNVPSRRLLERVGFLQEGICREHFLIEGVPTNEVLYGLLRREFPRN